MKKLNTLIASCIFALSFFMGSVNATVITSEIIDNESYTTINGLDWLDWSYTQGMTQQEALTQFGSGYGAYRIATHDEAMSMLDAIYYDLYETTISWAGKTELNAYDTHDDINYMFKVESLLGASSPLETTTVHSYAFIGGEGMYGVREGGWVFGGSNLTWLGGDIINDADYSYMNAGVAIVRVPSPSMVIFFGLLFSCLIFGKLKRGHTNERHRIALS